MFLLRLSETGSRSFVITVSFSFQCHGLCARWILHKCQASSCGKMSASTTEWKIQQLEYQPRCYSFMSSFHVWKMCWVIGLQTQWKRSAVGVLFCFSGSHGYWHQLWETWCVCVTEWVYVCVCMHGCVCVCETLFFNAFVKTVTNTIELA